MNSTPGFDVLVVGGGVAGVAAALEAARAGMRTVLVEKAILLGGLATSGLINIYLPLCDGMGRQVIYGLAEELFHLSIRYGPGDVPAGWPDGAVAARADRYLTVFSPASFALALDEVLVKAGVELWLDTLFCQPVVEGNRVAGIEVENKSGRSVLRAHCIIDATGDADVACRAGAPCAEADNWLSLWAIEASLEAAERAVSAARSTVPLQEVPLGGVRMGAGAAGENAVPGMPRFCGTDAAQVTRFALEGRRLLRERYAQLHALGGKADRHSCFPVALPGMAQFRTTRRIVGQETLSDGQHDRHVETSIGLAPDWRKAGPVWEIPYGTLVPQRVTGLLTAGRCISSEGDAWEVTRVIPVAALTGQVAGLAAALAVQKHTTPDQLDAGEIQQRVGKKGMPWHIEHLIRQASNAGNGLTEGA